MGELIRRLFKRRPADFALVFCVFVLLVFGLIMIYSTSSYEASMELNDASYYFEKQIQAICFGLILLVFFDVVPYQKFNNQRIFYLCMLGCLILIVLLKSPLARTINGATRWIYIGSMSLQPAEVIKLLLILSTAFNINRQPRSINTLKGWCLVLAPPMVTSLILGAVSSNFSSAVIIMAIPFFMVFISTKNYKGYIILAAAAVVFVASTVLIVKSGAIDLGFRGNRIIAWLNPEQYATGNGYQTLQALYAIGSGGLTGRGIGESLQKLGYIPEAQNDMIFAVICEELGFVGALLIMLLFLVLLYRCYYVALHARDLYGTMIASGVMIHLAVQVILNIAVVTNTTPNTGVSLPFISYGGSSVCFLMAEIGMIMNVSRQMRIPRKKADGE